MTMFFGQSTIVVLITISLMFFIFYKTIQGIFVFTNGKHVSIVGGDIHIREERYWFKSRKVTYYNSSHIGDENKI